MTGTFQLILHKKADLAGRVFADLTYPLIETETDWVLTGSAIRTIWRSSAPRGRARSTRHRRLIWR